MIGFVLDKDFIECDKRLVGQGNLEKNVFKK